MQDADINCVTDLCTGTSFASIHERVQFSRSLSLVTKQRLAPDAAFMIYANRLCSLIVELDRQSRDSFARSRTKKKQIEES